MLEKVVDLIKEVTFKLLQNRFKPRKHYVSKVTATEKVVSSQFVV